MTAKRESAFTELFDVLKVLRDILRARRINIPALLCAFGLALIANHCFWVAVVFWSLSANEAVHEQAHHLALEMFDACGVAAMLALFCLYFAHRKRILQMLYPRRQL